MSASTDEKAQAAFWRRNLPFGTTAPAGGQMTVCTTSQTFGPFEPGDYVILSCEGRVHVRAGGAADAATSAYPALPEGLHDFVMPDGTSHVNIIASSGGTRATVWKSS